MDDFERAEHEVAFAVAALAPHDALAILLSTQARILADAGIDADSDVVASFAALCARALPARIRALRSLPPETRH